MRTHLVIKKTSRKTSKHGREKSLEFVHWDGSDSSLHSVMMLEKICVIRLSRELAVYDMASMLGKGLTHITATEADVFRPR